jgi:hypothetical protein
MTHLSREAQAMLDTTREADTPSASDRERVKRTVLGRVALAAAAASSTAGAASAAAGSAAAMGSTATITAVKVHATVAWIVTSLAVGGTAGVGVVAWDRAQHFAASVAAHEVLPSGAAPSAASTASPRVEAAMELEPPLAPAAATREQALAPPSKSAGSGAMPRATVGAEVALLREAREALREGRPSRAIEVLGEHARRFPAGALAEERRAIRAIALCQASPGPGSRAEAESFLKSAPDSPLVERVRAACFDGAEGAYR